MHYDKLVRDNVPDIMRAKGSAPVTHVADDAEYGQRLKAKLVEEAGEYFRDESENEIADVLEVVDAICAFRGISLEHVHEVQRKKREERGGFAGRIILDEA
jgi:predicted house-cleaning noncanonical NTP pyrophosphatase (MazG superfamily)